MELAVARESANITCVWQRLEGRQWSWEAFWWEKGRKAWVCPDWRLLAGEGKVDTGYVEVGRCIFLAKGSHMYDNGCAFF